MLLNSTVNATWPLAQKLAKAGFLIEAKDNSFLELLTNIAISNYSTESLINKAIEKEINDNDFFINSIVNSSNMDLKDSSPSLQKIVSEKTLAALEQKALKEIEFAKNFIKPIIVRVKDKTQAFWNIQRKKNIEFFNVKYFSFNDLLNCSNLRILVDNYSTTEPKSFRLSCPIINPPDNILEYIQTGQYEIDQYQERLIESYFNVLFFEGTLTIDKDLFLKGLWLDLFGPNNGNKFLTDVLTFDLKTLFNAIFSFFIVMAIRKNPPANINMDLNNFENYFAELQAQIGRILFRWFKDADNAVKNKKLDWKNVNSKFNEIYLNKDTLSLYFEDEGTIDALFGCLIENKSLDYNDLLKNKTYYEEIYSKNIQFKELEEKENNYRNFIEAIRTAVTEEINNLSIDNNLYNKSELHEKLKLFTSKIPKKEYYDIWDYSKKIVCACFCSETDTEKFLDFFEESSSIIKSNNIDNPRETALLATVLYITNLLMEYITIEDYNQ